MEDLDYIEIAIDRQLACHWPDTCYSPPSNIEIKNLRLYNSKRCKEVNCNWAPRRPEPCQSIPLPKFTPQMGSSEDLLIAAIDAQYSRIFSRNYKMMEYLDMGYTQTEVGKFFGVSQSKVHRIMKKLRVK